MKKLPRRHMVQLTTAVGTALCAPALLNCSAKNRPQGGSTPQPSTASPLRSEKRRADPVILRVSPLPQGPWPVPDPFLFCVHHDDHYPSSNGRFGPSVSLEGRELGQDFARKDGFSMYHGRTIPGFPAHPHRGFETVTVVRTGLLDHSDSLGAAARYGEGDVQWLTAGSGIQHAEMFPLLNAAKANPLELFQIWLNLPRSKKLVTPHFAMLWAGSIPNLQRRDAAGRLTEVSVRAGGLEGVFAPKPPPNSWAAAEENGVSIWTIRMSPKAKWTLPEAAPGLSRSLYLFRGKSVLIGNQALGVSHVATLDSAVPLALENGDTEAELLLLQGRPIGEPIARRGPFVMNTELELRQAYSDFRETQFGGWPWPSSDPVHGASAERFAKRPDGSVERPG